VSPSCSTRPKRHTFHTRTPSPLKWTSSFCRPLSPLGSPLAIASRFPRGGAAQATGDPAGGLGDERTRARSARPSRPSRPSRLSALANRVTSGPFPTGPAPDPGLRGAAGASGAALGGLGGMVAAAGSSTRASGRCNNRKSSVVQWFEFPDQGRAGSPGPLEVPADDRLSVHQSLHEGGAAFMRRSRRSSCSDARVLIMSELCSPTLNLQLANILPDDDAAHAARPRARQNLALPEDSEPVEVDLEAEAGGSQWSVLLDLGRAVCTDAADTERLRAVLRSGFGSLDALSSQMCAVIEAAAEHTARALRQRSLIERTSRMRAGQEAGQTSADGSTRTESQPAQPGSRRKLKVHFRGTDCDAG